MKVDTVVKVADETWIATALLHRENPKRKEFTAQEIIDRARRERIHRPLRPGITVHVYQHCVANQPPNPGRYRMLLATGKNTRRLFRPSDEYHPDREGGKITPKKEDIPQKYWPLLDWYESKYARAGTGQSQSRPDPIEAMRGMWKGLWKDEDPDAYVDRLRQWD